MKEFLNKSMQYFFGSKSIDRIPRTYEALKYMPSHEDVLVETQYLGETICSLVNQLKKDQVDPRTVQIFEVYNNSRESQLPASLYTTRDGKWFPRTELCKMTTRYGKEEKHPTCSFQDRHGKVCGPYYDLVPG